MLSKKTYQFFNLIFFTALLLCCGSCGSDIVDPQDMDSQHVQGKDKFVISYSLVQTRESRGLKETPANELISSLHYYVYDKANDVLVKKRQIRGINRNTVWPISDRSKMSWELRQDLQDTLQNGLKYRILFVANIDSKLFNQVKDDTGKMRYQTIVRDDDHYNTARLSLPQEGFESHNMYYMWEGELDRTLPECGKETVKKDAILLRRIITRTDFSRELLLGVDGKEDEYQTLYHAIDHPGKGMYDVNCAARVEAAINKKFGDLEEKIHKKIRYRDVAIPLTYPYTGKNGEGAKFEKFFNTHRNDFIPVLREVLISKFVKAIQANNTAWKNTVWSHDSTTARNVKVHFVPDSRVNVMYFDRTRTVHEGQANDIETYTVHPDGTFSSYGFGAQSMNHIESMHFYDNQSETETFSVSGVPFNNSTAQEKNRLYKVKCQPADYLIYGGNYEGKDQITIDLDDFFLNKCGPTIHDEWLGFKNYTEKIENTVLAKYRLPFWQYVTRFVFEKDIATSKENFKDFTFIFDDSLKGWEGTGLPNLDAPATPLTFFPAWNIVTDTKTMTIR